MFYYLSHIKEFGSVSILKLKDKFENLSDILQYSINDLRGLNLLNEIQISNLLNYYENLESVIKEYEYLLKSGIRYITVFDDDYPRKLREIINPPVVLFVKGELPQDDMPTVAIIGSRASTNYGNTVAEYFGECLADEGVGIISGMARGIDGRAHKGALKSVKGKTYAVLGGGVNVVYPRENVQIYDQIIDKERGGIISEMLPGTSAISQNFPMRNRIISGLSDIVLVIEAREQSGSMITVDLALEQGRDVLAVPGRVSDPMSRGCNLLIGNGAKIANSPSDVLELLNLSVKKITTFPEKNYNSLAKKEKIVYSTLDSAPKHLEEIVHQTGLPLRDVMSILLELEMKGFAVQISSNYYGLAV
ncbi:MAG: DNA-processing protein DprA [Lachnospiraceae bacterium]|nr:DNA-processing protein DprA [Lachnospiraceae bacterium]